MSASHTIKIEVNGEPHQTQGDCSVQALLDELSGDSGRTRQKSFAAVAVELNMEIVPGSQFESTILSEGDVVEIVSLVGGG
jgi:sulfur carrier protein